MVEIKATELVVNDEGCVVEVKAEDKDENELELKANKGVVLATGGFSANVELRSKYKPKLDSTIPTTNHSGATGDGICKAW